MPAFHLPTTMPLWSTPSAAGVAVTIGTAASSVMPAYPLVGSWNCMIAVGVELFCPVAAARSSAASLGSGLLASTSHARLFLQPGDHWTRRSGSLAKRRGRPGRVVPSQAARGFAPLPPRRFDVEWRDCARMPRCSRSASDWIGARLTARGLVGKAFRRLDRVKSLRSSAGRRMGRSSRGHRARCKVQANARISIAQRKRPHIHHSF